MNKEKSNMPYLLYQTIKDIFSIAPKSAVLQALGSVTQSIIAAISTLYISELFNTAQSYIEGANVRNKLLFIVIVLAILYMVHELADSLFHASMLQIDSMVLYHLKIKLSKKSYQLPLIAYEDSKVLDNLSRAKHCLEELKLSDLSLSFLNIFSELLNIISIMLVLASFNVLLVPISLISVLPFLIVRMLRGKQFYELRWFQAKKERKKNYLYHLFNNKQSMKEIRMLGIGDYLEQEWTMVRDVLNKETWDFRKKDILSLFFCDLLKISGYLISVGFVLYLTTNGNLSIGMLAACMVAFSTFQTQTKYLFINIGRIPECAAFTSDFYKFIDQEDEKTGNQKLQSENTDIRMKNVTFCYPNTTQKAIRNLSLDIKKGERVVILGENGSGKSTLIMLLLGLYKCEEGNVFWGNQNIEDIDLYSIFNTTSLVSQNFTKYSLSVRENVAISDIKKINEEQKILDILKSVGLEQLVDENDLDTELGKEFGGKELSLGQWQKLAIARSLFKDSNLIILDEPTAALDPIIEADILKQFLSISKEKTTIIVSHRVGLCKEVDKVIVMKNGEEIECGSHNELMKNRGEYYRLYSMQSKWYN
jgi:ABC-type bacteriocin/lantibiotic exporter with double-glycine peptidase domain